MATVSDGVYVPQTGLVPPVSPAGSISSLLRPRDPEQGPGALPQAGSPPLTLTYS